MCGERRDLTMTCERVFSTNHSEPSNDWQLNQQWQHVYDQTFNQTAVVFYYMFSLLGAKQSSCVCHQQTPFTGVKLWAHVYIIDKELLLRVVISNLHQLAEVLNPYIGYCILFKIMILY